MKLYDRTAVVTIRRTEQTDTERRFFLTLPNVTTIRDLRIQFAVKKSGGKSPNTCELQLTNLAPQTRAEVEGKGIVVSIAAGHDGAPRHLFTGDVRVAYSQIEDSEWITTIHLAEGGRAFGQARVKPKCYRPGTPVATILKDVAASMGLELPREITASPDLRTQFATGYSLEGPSRDELTRLLAPFGYGWSIQNGRLQVLRDSDVAVGVAREISEDKGMIGSPKFDTPSKKQTRKLSVPVLLYPELTPGGAIIVRSASINGNFKITELTHQGDTHDDGPDSWTTNVEAV